MDSKKSPKGRKRSNKAVAGSSSGGFGGAEEHCWDCSVCTFRNNAEAFKCSMCGVRKGTSTRKPRLNADLVAQQQAQALTPPPMALGGVPIPSSSGMSVKSPSSAMSDDGSDMGAGEGGEFEGAPGDEEETDLAALASLKANKRVSKDKDKVKPKKEPKKTVSKARLKNVDRSSATYHSVTVNDFTVVITEYQPKAKKEKKEKGPKTNGNHPPKDKDKDGDGKNVKNGKIKEEPPSATTNFTSASSTTSSSSATTYNSPQNSNKAAIATPAMMSYPHPPKDLKLSIPSSIPHAKMSMNGSRTPNGSSNGMGSLASIPPDHNSSSIHNTEIKPTVANGVGLNGTLSSANVPESTTSKSSSAPAAKESTNAMLGFPT